MSSGPEPVPPGEDWRAVERLQDRVYAPRFDTSVPHPARRYNYWLGGKDNFAADRESGDEVARTYPSIRIAAIENRRFLRRAVEYLAGERGIRQFLDIGTGLPSADNTHEIAQRIAPQSRIVYVDNDPLVMVHARALLTSAPQGHTAYIERDLRDPHAIVAEAMKVLDFDQPIGLGLVAVLHFLLDADKPAEVVEALREAMPAGSYLVVSHATGDPVDAATRDHWDQLAESGLHGVFQYRSRAQILDLLSGWDLPVLMPVAEWGRDPDSDPPVAFADAAAYGGIGLKPA